MVLRTVRERNEESRENDMTATTTQETAPIEIERFSSPGLNFEAHDRVAPALLSMNAGARHTLQALHACRWRAGARKWATRNGARNLWHRPSKQGGVPHNPRPRRPGASSGGRPQQPVYEEGCDCWGLLMGAESVRLSAGASPRRGCGTRCRSGGRACRLSRCGRAAHQTST